MANVSGKTSKTQQERIAMFLKNLRHKKAEYRWGAAEALGRLGDKSVVDDLIQIMNDDDWRVRTKAAWALGRLGDSKALPFLMHLVRDDVETVQEMARESIRAIQKQQFRSTTDNNQAD